MKIIVGLGNPGKKYENTRHNVGFQIVDKIQQDFEFPAFEFNKKFNAYITKLPYSLLPLGEGARRADEGTGKEVLLVKPQTFMNLSGEAVRAIIDFYKLTAEDILVVHDELDLALGRYKIATDSSSAGHNGVQNIIDQLGTQKFTRVRIGVGEEREGAPVCRLGAHDFVLGKFSEEEKETFEKISPEIISEIKKLL